MRNDWLNDQLDDVLRDMARHDSGLTPPASLERRTLAAYDAWRHAAPATRARSPLALRIAAVVAAAAALLAAIVVPSSRGGRAAAVPTPHTRAPLPATAPSTAGGALGMVPIDSDAVAGRDGPLHRASAMRLPLAVRREGTPHAAAAARRQETLRFTRIDPGWDDDVARAFHLSRVQVPRRVLIDLGVLVEGRQGDEPIDADVMFGEDGMARAIRLAPAARRVP